MVTLSSRINGIFSEKNCFSIITSCNSVFLEYAGVSSDDKIIGFSDYDFPWNEYAHIYREHEKDAISGNNYSTIIPFKAFDGTESLFLHTKIQKNDNAGNVVGVICRAIEIINPEISNLIKTLAKKSPFKNTVISIGKKTKIDLPAKQAEVLFYLTRGKSAKTIAMFMNLSVRTIEHYIEIIKKKTDCKTLSELISFAIHHQYSEALPNDSIKKIAQKVDA